METVTTKPNIVSWMMILLMLVLVPVLLMPTVQAPPPSPPADPAIAYVAQGTTPKLNVMNADGSNKASIYSDKSCQMMQNPSWSPDGKAIAFRQTCFQAGVYVTAVWRVDVSVVNGVPKGSNPRQLSTSAACASCFDPAWSPTGDVIAVGGGGGGTPPSPLQIPSIFLVDANTGAVTTLYTAAAGSVRVLYSTWSSDGQRLAVTEADPSGVDSIKILNRTGNVLRTLVPGVFNLITHIDWARGLEKLAITERDCGAVGVCIYTVDFTFSPETVTRIVNGNAPAWSPDNTKLAFGDSPKVKTVELATGKIATLTTIGDFADWRRF